MDLDKFRPEHGAMLETPSENTPAPGLKPPVGVRDHESWMRMLHEIQLLAQQIDQEATQPRGERRATWALAWTFKTTEDRIRTERSDLGLGLGELAIARALVNATGSSPQSPTVGQVIGLRAREGRWGEALCALQAAGLVDVRELWQVVRQIRAAMVRAGPCHLQPAVGPHRAI